MSTPNDDDRGRRSVSRRTFLKGTAMGLGASAFGGLLAACGSAPAPATSATSAATAAAAGGAAPNATGAAAAPPAAAPATSAATLRFVTNHGESDLPLFKTVLDNFRAQHPEITIDHLNIAAGEEFYTSIQTQGVGGNLPDVWYVRTFDVAPYASRNWLVPLDEYVTRDANEVKRDDFWPAQVAQMTYQGKLYTLPYDFSDWGIYYNRTMFEAEGVPLPTDDMTWDDIFGLAERFVKKEGGNQTRWGMTTFSAGWLMWGTLESFGGKLFSDDFKKSLINSPENIQTYKKFYDMAVRGVTPLPGATPQGVDPFAGGLVAMKSEGSWATNSTRDAVGDRFKWDVVKIPKGSTGKRFITPAGGAWGIAATSKFPDQAWTFMKFLASTESINIMVAEPVRSVPGRQSSASAWEKAVASGGLPPQNAKIFPTMLQEDAISVSYPAFWKEFDQIWTQRAGGIFTGTPVEEALATMEAEVNELLQRPS